MVIDDTLIMKIGMWGILPAFFILLFFIIYNLAKESKAGKFGTFIMFLILGLGILVFIIKQVAIFYIEK